MILFCLKVYCVQCTLFVTNKAKHIGHAQQTQATSSDSLSESRAALNYEPTILIIDLSIFFFFTEILCFNVNIFWFISSVTVNWVL